MRSEVAVLFLGFVACVLACACGEPLADCSLTQGWDDRIARNAVATPARELIVSPKGYGITLWLEHEEVTVSDGMVIPSTIVSLRPRLSIAVESRELDGGNADFGFVVLVDSSQLMIPPVSNWSEDGGVYFMTLELDGSDLADGAHDVIVAASRRHLPGVAGTRLAWLRNGGKFSFDVPEVAHENVQWDLGSTVQLLDGGFVLPEADVGPPVNGSYSFNVTVQSRISECVSYEQRSRLFVLLDALQVLTTDKPPVFDLVYPVGDAARVSLQMEGLQQDSAFHKIEVVQVDAVGRFQFKPDGAVSPWFSPLAADIGAASW